MNIQVKRTFKGKLFFFILLNLIRLRLIKLETAAIFINNHILSKKTFKYRVGKGKWSTLDMSSHEVEVVKK